MTYKAGKKSVGFRDAQVYAINEDGYPAAPSTAAYVGFLIPGPKAFTLNVPTPQVIPHIGRDYVEETDQLPSREAPTGEIRSSGVDLDVDAFLQGVKKFSVGAYSEVIARATDKQGAEPEVGIIAWQQSKEDGKRRWHYCLVPSTRAVVLGEGMEENPVDHRYQININPMSSLPWGTALTELTHGTKKSGFFDLYSTLRPEKQYPMVAFKANGSATEFTFEDYKTGRSDYPVFVNGVLQTTEVTKADGSFEFDYPPAEDAIITIWLV